MKILVSYFLVFSSAVVYAKTETVDNDDSLKVDGDVQRGEEVDLMEKEEVEVNEEGSTTEEFVPSEVQRDVPQDVFSDHSKSEQNVDIKQKKRKEKHKKKKRKVSKPQKFISCTSKQTICTIETDIGMVGDRVVFHKEKKKEGLKERKKKKRKLVAKGEIVSMKGEKGQDQRALVKIHWGKGDISEKVIPRLVKMRGISWKGSFTRHE